MCIRSDCGIACRKCRDICIVKADRSGQLLRGCGSRRVGIQIFGHGGCAADDHIRRGVIDAGKGDHDGTGGFQIAVGDGNLIGLGKDFAFGQVLQHGVTDVERIEDRAIAATRRRQGTGREGTDIVGQRGGTVSGALNCGDRHRKCRCIGGLDVIESDGPVQAGGAVFSDVGLKVFGIDDIGCVVHPIHAHNGGQRRVDKGCPVGRSGAHGVAERNVNERPVIKCVEDGGVAVESDHITVGRQTAKGSFDVGSSIARGQRAANRDRRCAGGAAGIVGVQLFIDVGYPDFRGGIHARAQQVDGDVIGKAGASGRAIFNDQRVTFVKAVLRVSGDGWRVVAAGDRDGDRANGRSVRLVVDVAAAAGAVVLRRDVEHQCQCFTRTKEINLGIGQAIGPFDRVVVGAVVDRKGVFKRGQQCGVADGPGRGRSPSVVGPVQIRPGYRIKISVRCVCVTGISIGNGQRAIGFQVAHNKHIGFRHGAGVAVARANLYRGEIIRTGDRDSHGLGVGGGGVIAGDFIGQRQDLVFGQIVEQGRFSAEVPGCLVGPVAGCVVGQRAVCNLDKSLQRCIINRAKFAQYTRGCDAGDGGCHGFIAVDVRDGQRIAGSEGAAAFGDRAGDAVTGFNRDGGCIIAARDRYGHVDFVKAAQAVGHAHGEYIVDASAIVKRLRRRE